MWCRAVATRSSPSRHSTATHPCPTAGTNSAGSSRSAIRSVRPRISSAATAITIAPPSGTLSSRVWMLPRSSTNSRSGRARRSWARRRTEPVATVAPAGRSTSVRPTSASAALRRCVNAAMRSPSATSVGRSSAECTARSARPSSTARWTSFTNTPCPPIECSGTPSAWVRSPKVSMNTSSAS